MHKQIDLLTDLFTSQTTAQAMRGSRFQNARFQRGLSLCRYVDH